MHWECFDGLIQAALTEDRARRDVTTRALVGPGVVCDAMLVVKQHGVICGLPLAGRLCQLFDERVQFHACREDGSRVEPGTTVAELTGPAASVLSIERTMLNFLQRLSGVATLTRLFVDAIEGTGAQLLDTRKTTPGWRALEKYAVRCGGGTNHRMSLADQVLIKDNHLRLWRTGGQPGRGIAAAIEAARTSGLPVEVEVESLEELADALRAAPDIVMLDNMTPEEVRRAVESVRSHRPAAPGGRTLVEASGAMTLANVRAYAEAGADRISVGALTHSAPALDISLTVR